MKNLSNRPTEAKSGVSFFVGGKPVGQGRMSSFNGRAYYTNAAELKPWRQLIGICARNAGAKPTDKPIELTLKFFIERGKTVKRGYPTVPVDLDKLCRAIFDSLSSISYTDDAQVVSLHASKVYGNPQGVAITITEILSASP